MGIVNLIRDCVHVLPQPAIAIGGGLDSAIILHHLREKTDEPLYTYTLTFYELNEFDTEYVIAENLAEHYGANHTTIRVKSVLKDYPELLRQLSQPRYTLWVARLMRACHEDQRVHLYVGEGADEHFGGFWYKPLRSYVEQWSNLFVWGLPTYRELAAIYDLEIVTPFLNLDWRLTRRYFDYEQHKKALRHAYDGVLPRFVVARKKAPAHPNWQRLFYEELRTYFPKAKPRSDAEIKTLLNLWVTQEWVKSHAPRHRKRGVVDQQQPVAPTT